MGFLSDGPRNESTFFLPTHGDIQYDSGALADVSLSCGEGHTRSESLHELTRYYLRLFDRKVSLLQLLTGGLLVCAQPEEPIFQKAPELGLSQGKRMWLILCSAACSCCQRH